MAAGEGFFEEAVKVEIAEITTFLWRNYTAITVGVWLGFVLIVVMIDLVIGAVQKS